MKAGITTEETKWLYKVEQMLRHLGGIVSDGSSGTTTITPGVTTLTSNGANWTNGSGNYRAVSMTIVSIGTGSVSLTMDGVTTSVNYLGLSLSWSIDKAGDTKLGSISITTNGDAKVVITYTRY